MMKLNNVQDVMTLQSNLRATFESPQGKEVMNYFESLCGWYDFQDTDPNIILIKLGKRQVLATIKTLLTLKPEQVVQLAKEQDNDG